jgi:heat shock protein HslJ
MRFEKAGSTRRGCPGAIAVQEKPFLDALNIAATDRSMGEFLELLDEVKPARSSIDKPY